MPIPNGIKAAIVLGFLISISVAGMSAQRPPQMTPPLIVCFDKANAPAADRLCRSCATLLAPSGFLSHASLRYNQEKPPQIHTAGWGVY
jgi:hypothetical protein